MAHPIRPDLVYEQNNFYTVTVYDKGAEVIRMIHTLIGEKAFQAGMKLYISRFDGGCATCDDFVQAMQDASGYDLTRFRNWYCYDGTPLVEVSEEYDHESGTLRITFRQSIPSTPYRDRSAYPAMVIPLKLEFLDASGRQIPVSAPEVNDGLFVLTEKEQTVTFSNVTELPAVSYLGDFSAPVKISRTYSSEELLNIASHTANDFNRYEAIWQLYTNFFRGYVEHNESDVKGLIDSYAVMLANPEIDRLFLAEILAVPTEVQIASMFENVDIERIHEGREYLLNELAVHLKEQWQKVYRDNYRTEGEYSIEPLQVAQRALANLALGFVARFMGESADSLVKEHYYSADNMTDTLAALKVAVHAGLPCSEQLLAEFDEKWHEDGLIMDNWFRIQASVAKASTLAKVKELMNHRSFTMTNPNRIRALIGTFAMANPFVFHAKDASGYEFITEILTRLNESNPQTAARIIDPMIKFKRYDQTRQKLIAGCLEKLFALPQLAPDLYEKIARALGK
jgi:aminopeptidase N